MIATMTGVAAAKREPAFTSRVTVCKRREFEFANDDGYLLYSIYYWNAASIFCQARVP